jgi:hypothetical protein
MACFVIWLSWSILAELMSYGCFAELLLAGSVLVMFYRFPKLVWFVWYIYWYVGSVIWLLVIKVGWFHWSVNTWLYFHYGFGFFNAVTGLYQYSLVAGYTLLIDCWFGDVESVIWFSTRFYIIWPYIDFLVLFGYYGNYTDLTPVCLFWWLVLLVFLFTCACFSCWVWFCAGWLKCGLDKFNNGLI